MADSAAPIAYVVRNWWVCTERLGQLFIREARLRDSLVAGRTPVDNVHSRQPDLIDVRTVVGGQLFCFCTMLSKTPVGALVLFPPPAKALDGRGAHTPPTNPPPTP